MRIDGLWVTGPVVADVEQLASTLGRLSGWRLRADLDLVALHHTLVRMLRSRDGIDREDGGALPAWVHDAIHDYLRVLPSLTGQGASVFSGAAACGNARLLAGLASTMLGVVVVDDPRRSFRPVTSDLVADAVVHGRTWARTARAAVSVARGHAHWRVVCLVDAEVGPSLGGWLRRLGLPVSNAVLHARSPCSWDPLMEAALRVDPEVDRVCSDLRMPSPICAPPDAHPSLALAHVEAALEARDRARAEALLPHCPEGTEKALMEARIALQEGNQGCAAGHLEAQLPTGRGLDAARILALQLGDHPLATRVASGVTASDPEQVRVAVADWLVALGMDVQAAEVVARVEGTGWRSGVRVVS